jgi:beta-N-acetylhexosaminidase
MKLIKENIGQLIVTGFKGTSPNDDGVKNIIAQAEAGIIGGVILFRYNIENPAQLAELTAALKGAKSKYPLFIALDQEGGKVQRINSQKGFSDFDSAQKVARERSPEQAYSHYREMGKMLHQAGFNFNFAPCVDVDSEPPGDAIGKLERSYSLDPEIVASYAESMVKALRESRIISCLKHFPGHGSARADSHLGLVDITDNWSERELIPYQQLTKQGMVDCVMSAHLVHNTMDKDTPILFSKTWIDKLRIDIGYNGVLVTDDLHMGAIIHNFSIAEIARGALFSGHDLLIFSNNSLAAQAQGIKQDETNSTTQKTVQRATVPDPQVAEVVLQEIDQALDSGTLQESRVAEAVTRVLNLKNKFL